MNKKCCHCFENILLPDTASKCHGCKFNIHLDCLDLTKDEKRLIPRMQSSNLKLFCNRCNVAVTAANEVKQLVNELKANIDLRFQQLENLIQNTVAQSYTDKENTINESVERSLRASNIILYNVPVTAGVNDCDLVNDILEVIDSSLVASPDDVLQIGSSNNGKPRLLKVRFRNFQMARLCLKKKSALLAHGQYSKVVISDDKTKQQQNILRSLRDELKTRVDNGESNLTIKYINKTPQIVTQKN